MTTLYQSSITIDGIIDALGDFLQPFIGSAEIVRAQGNRVPMPEGPCVVLTELRTSDLETPIISNSGSVNQITATGPKLVDVQIDFYGPASGDWCSAIKGIFRTSYSAAQFPDGIKPLYCSDGIQAPLVTGEQQWESRWTLTASLQFNPAVIVPQQFADVVTPSIKAPVDVFYDVE